MSRGVRCGLWNTDGESGTVLALALSNVPASGSLLKDLRAWESYSGDPIAAADLSQARLELISCLFLGRVGTYLARDSLGLTNSKVVQC